MFIKKIFNKRNITKEIYGIIEISAFSLPVKYEINKKFNILSVDRFIPAPVQYPCNYGFIPNTLGLDGDPLDLLIPTPYPVQPNTLIKCRPIGMLEMEDESGQDIKIIAVPHQKISEIYNNILDIQDLSNFLKNQIIYFFKNYKSLEKEKWVIIKDWKNAEHAKTEILKSLKRVQ